MKPTKAQIYEDVVRYAEQNLHLSRAVQVLINGEPYDRVQGAKQPDGSRHSYALLRPLAPDGGTLLYTFAPAPGQGEPHTVAYNAERILLGDPVSWPRETADLLAKMKDTWYRAHNNVAA